jgi:hypothetical protein
MSVAAAFADPNSARTRLRVATLDQWARAGLDLANQVLDAAGRDIVEAVRIVFRLTQAARLAIFLATHLSDPTNPAFQPPPAKPRAAPKPEPETRADTEPAQTVALEKLDRDRQARSRDREVSDAAILRRPLIDIIKVICRNLGVVPDWSLWTDAPEPTAAAAPPPERPRPEPNPDVPRLQGPCLHRVLGRRLVQSGPTEQAPAPPGLRARLRSTAAPLALSPIAPRRAVASARPAEAERPWSADVLVGTFTRPVTHAL